jgi:hypothetical protein
MLTIYIMDYKKKYFKYSMKYKNLLQLNGGAAADDPDLIRALEESMKTLQLQQPQMAEAIRRSKTDQEPRLLNDIQGDYDNSNRFIIFTTGIADDRLRNFWLSNNLHLHILSLIPTSFTEVKFIHFDPDIRFDQSPEMGINESDIIKINMQVSDSERIIESSFYKDFFPYTNIDFTRLNHLVIDFAHLFKYEPHAGGIVKTSGHYREQNPGGDPIIGMKSIYIFYDGIFKLYTTNFFIFNERSELVTYIERMMELGFIFKNPSYPIDSVSDIINSFIINELFKESKKHGISMHDFDRIFTNSDELKSNLTITFINEFLWMPFSREEVLERFKNHIKLEFIRISRKNGLI